jgi:hypothetical protein
VRQPVAFEFVVEIGVRVEVEDGQAGDVLAEGAHNWQGNGVVATQADRAQTVVEQLTDFPFDRGERLIENEFQIAGIAARTLGAEVDAGFRPHVRRNGIEGHADDRRRSRCSTQPGRVGIEWDAENDRGSGLGRVGTKGHGSVPLVSE